MRLIDADALMNTIAKNACGAKMEAKNENE